MARLVVIAGPIGSGKSTTAELLAHTLAGRAIATAAVDLDDVAFMQRGGVADVDEFWRRGVSATARVVRAWFDLGVEVVVTHGPFFESGGYSELLDQQVDTVEVAHVLLRVSFETALARVTGDSQRGISQDPGFLRATHERFREIERTLPHPRLEFDTDLLSAAAIADRLVEALIHNGS